MERMSILLSTCDAYADLWPPFFSCIEKFTAGNVLDGLKFYINTEHKKIEYSREGWNNIITLNQESSKTIPWSKRMRQALERIEEPYIFLLLDDFFACDAIRWDLLSQILDIMDSDKSIASFQLYGTRIRNSDPENYMLSDEMNYRLMGKDGWKTHFVPTVWRKDVLMRWLRPWESIWAFESCGSARARRWNYKEKVYIVDSPPIYDYLWIKDCSAVINGKWLNEPELIGFFEENNIPVDFSARGKMSHAEYRAITMKDIVKRYTLPQIVVKAFNRFRSLF